MTIKYRLDIPGKTPALISEYICFGHLANMTKGLNPKEVEKFEGISLILDKSSLYYKDTTSLQRQEMERLFQELGFAESFKNKVTYIYNKKDELLEINFLADHLNTYQVVISASVFRMYSDHKHFFENYNLLVEKGYHPLVAYVTSCMFKPFTINVFNKHNKDKTIEFAGVSGHMPFPYFHGNPAVLPQLQKVIQTGKSNYCNFRSMKKELKDNGYLSYSGRDAWLRGFNTSNLPKNSTTSIFHQLVGNRTHHPYIIPPFRVRHLLKGLDILEKSLCIK